MCTLRTASLLAAVLACAGLACPGSTPTPERRTATPPPSREPIPRKVEPPKINPKAAPLYRVPRVSVWNRQCRSEPAKGAVRDYRKKKVYEFEAFVVEPLPYGPRIAQLPRQNWPRQRKYLRKSLQTHAGHVTTCYNWAYHRKPGLKGVVTVQLEVDPWGVVTAFKATPSNPALGPFVRCVAAPIRNHHFGSLTARRTRIAFTIQLKSSGRWKTRKRYRRPRTRRVTRPGRQGCVHTSGKVVADQVTFKKPLFRADDSEFESEVKAERELRRRVREWIRKGRRGPRPERSRRPWIHGHGARIIGGLSARYFYRLIRFNLGAYRACWRQALHSAGGKALDGKLIKISVLFKDDGSARASVAVSSANHVGLETCMKKAVQALRLYHSPLRLTTRKIFLSIPFKFRATPRKPALVPLPSHPLTAARIERRARALLDRGDGGGALGHYSALIKELPRHQRRCEWHVGAWRAVLVQEPWFGRATDAALSGLVRHLQRHATAPATRACVARALPELMKRLWWEVTLARQYEHRDLQLQALRRLQRLLELALYLPVARKHLYRIAQRYESLRLYTRACPLYKRIGEARPANRLSIKAARLTKSCYRRYMKPK